MKQHNKQIEKYRIREGKLASDASFGNNGAFMVNPTKSQELGIIVSDGEGWDHVSVSTQARCPTWQEMCWVKDLFFSSSEVVIQYHSAKRDYVNNHPYCLHLWKPHGLEIPIPPASMVGIK